MFLRFYISKLFTPKILPLQTLLRQNLSIIYLRFLIKYSKSNYRKDSFRILINDNPQIIFEVSTNKHYHSYPNQCTTFRLSSQSRFRDWAMKLRNKSREESRSSMTSKNASFSNYLVQLSLNKTRKLLRTKSRHWTKPNWNFH